MSIPKVSDFWHRLQLSVPNQLHFPYNVCYCVLHFYICILFQYYRCGPTLFYLSIFFYIQFFPFQLYLRHDFQPSHCTTFLAFSVSCLLHNNKLRCFVKTLLFDTFLCIGLQILSNPFKVNIRYLNSLVTSISCPAILRPCLSPPTTIYCVF